MLDNAKNLNVRRIWSLATGIIMLNFGLQNWRYQAKLSYIRIYLEYLNLGIKTILGCTVVSCEVLWCFTLCPELNSSEILYNAWARKLALGSLVSKRTFAEIQKQTRLTPQKKICLSQFIFRKPYYFGPVLFAAGWDCEQMFFSQLKGRLG